MPYRKAYYRAAHIVDILNKKKYKYYACAASPADYIGESYRLLGHAFHISAWNFRCDIFVLQISLEAALLI